MTVQCVARKCLEDMPLLKAPKTGFGEAEKTGQTTHFVCRELRGIRHDGVQQALSGVFQHRWGLFSVSALDLPRFSGAFPHRGRVCAAGVVKPHFIPRPEFPRTQGNKDGPHTDLVGRKATPGTRL